VNQWLTLRKPSAGSNLADMGRCAVRDHTRMVRSTPTPRFTTGEEVTVKVCGVAVAMLPGYSWVPR
jgi:hypothetical protein